MPPEAPSAPPAGVNIVRAAPKAAPTAPTREINISSLGPVKTSTQKPSPGAAAIRPPGSANNPPPDEAEEPASPPAVAPAPKPKTAKERMEQDLDKVADDNAIKPPAKSEDAPAAPAADAPKKATKANPWDLYKSEKLARAKAESEAQELRTRIAPEQDRVALTERAQKAEARLKHLEDEVRFIDYSKSTEFQQNYVSPLETAFGMAMDEVKELSIVDRATQQPRAVTPQDMMELVNMPLGQAQDVADEVFGKFAGTVMAHRKEIKGLLNKQNAALEDAKKNGSERLKQRQQQQTEAQQAAGKALVDEFTQLLEESKKDILNAEYYAAKVFEEGYEPTPEEVEHNEAISKAEQFVKEVFEKSPTEPGITAEERKRRIKQRVALRNRAVAYSPMKRALKRMTARVKELEGKLGSYQETAPAAGRGDRPSAPKTAVKGWDSLNRGLEKLAGIGS